MESASRRLPVGASPHTLFRSELGTCTPPCWKTMARISPTVLRAQLDRDPALRAQIEAELEAEQEALDATHGVQLDMLDSMEAS